MSKFAPPPAAAGATITYTPATVAGGAAAGAAAGSLSTTLSGTVSWSVLAGALAVSSSGVLTTTGVAPANAGGGSIAATVYADNGSDGVGKHVSVPVGAYVAPPGVTPDPLILTSATFGAGAFGQAITGGKAAVPASVVSALAASLPKPFVVEIRTKVADTSFRIALGQFDGDGNASWYIGANGGNAFIAADTGSGAQSIGNSGSISDGPHHLRLEANFAGTYVERDGVQIGSGSPLKDTGGTISFNPHPDYQWAGFVDEISFWRTTRRGVVPSASPLTGAEPGLIAAYALNGDGAALLLTAPQPLPAITRDHPSIVFPRGAAGTFDEEQFFDPRVVDVPSGPYAGRYMFFSGLAAPVATGPQSIGILTCPDPTDAYTWTNKQRVLGGTAGGADAAGVRLGDVKLIGSTLTMLYTGQPAQTGTDMFIGLATCPIASDFRVAANWTKVGPILTGSGQGRNDGNSVNDADLAVLPDGSYSVIYGWHDDANSKVLQSKRFATGTSLTALTKQSVLAEFQGAGGGVQYEWGQRVQRSGDTWDYVYEMGGPVGGTIPYRIRQAVSITGPNGPFFDSGDWLLPTKQAGTFDRYHVATPAMFTFNGQRRVFYQGAADVDQPYYNNTWNGGVARVG